MRNSYEIAKFIKEILDERNIKPAEYARMVGVIVVPSLGISTVQGKFRWMRFLR